jgi:uncharacterized GH25 family protein
MRTLLLGVVLALVAAVPLDAHDLWIEPSSFATQPGAIVSVRLRVGEHLVGDPVARDPALIREFFVDDAGERRAAVGRTGSDPAGLVRMASPGLALIAYHSHPSRVRLSGEKFDRYLKEEGLDRIAALRANAREQGDVRELFSRCAKSLVLTGPSGRSRQDRALGCAVELVSEKNPYALGPLDAGATLPVRLTFQGRPLEGALVVAMSRANPADRQSARSDADGRVRFRLTGGGMWLVKAVHMVAAPAGSDADWESFWASLTFDVPEGNHGQATARR